MAAARDQAARILRPEPDTAEGGTARDASAVLADQFRAHLSEETVGHRLVETPTLDKPTQDKPAIDRPADRPASAPPATAVSAAPKSGKRKLVLMGVGL